MSTLDVIGPGPWLHDDMMEPSTFFFFSSLLVFCIAAVVITIIVLLVVMWIRNGNETKESEEASDVQECNKEE